MLAARTLCAPTWMVYRDGFMHELSSHPLLSPKTAVPRSPQSPNGTKSTKGGQELSEAVEEDDGAREQDRPVVSRFYGVPDFRKSQSDKGVQKELLVPNGADLTSVGLGGLPGWSSRLF